MLTLSNLKPGYFIAIQLEFPGYMLASVNFCTSLIGKLFFTVSM
jgi:hypothetical protein